MAYPNAYPISYPQMFYPAQYQPTAQSPQNSGVIWVSGEAGAKAYLVAPNTTVQLWDSERQSIYLKSADATGMPSMKILDYTVREDARTGAFQKAVSSDDKSIDCVSRADFDALKLDVSGLRNELESLMAK